jgi:hypothetical protein
MNKTILWIKRRVGGLHIIIVGTKLMLKRESRETVVAAKILIKLIRNGKNVSSEEVIFLKKQSIDIGKITTLIGLQLIPGSSFGIIILEKIGKRRGFTIFPKEHELPETKKTTIG